VIFTGNSAALGGGMHNGGEFGHPETAGSPILTNVLFKTNSAIEGGGLFNENYVHADLTNVAFEGNTATRAGGGMEDRLGTLNLTNVVFRNNTAGLAAGGMQNFSLQASLTNVTFSGNSATTYGGGMVNSDADPNLDPTLTNVTFSGNAAEFGGGMWNHQSNPTLTDVVFSGNNAVSMGGGMFNEESSNPHLTNVIFSENSAGSGSGMFNTSSSPSLLNVTFSANVGPAGSRGGAMVNDLNSTPSLTNVTFVNNSVTFAGGAMLNSFSSHASLVNVTFVANSSSHKGGAIYNWESSPILKNVTFSDNSSDLGGAIFNEEDSHPNIVNSILYGDTGGEIHNNSSTSVVTHSIVQGGYAGTGNVDIDPLLGSLQDNGGFTETVALGAGSPAIDAGDNANCPATDQRGVTRPQGSHCDIGAYEYQDTTAPTVLSISRTTATPTSASNVDFTVTFSEAVTGVDTNDFTPHVTGSIAGASVSSVSGAGSVYTVTVSTGSGNGTLRLDVPAAATITGLDLNLLAGLPFSGVETYMVIKTASFSDVPSTHWAWSFIERLYLSGITTGCSTSPAQYCPESTVTRAQMAVFLERGIHGSSYAPPAVGASTGFGDVPTGYWAAAWIKQLAADGITSGCGGGNYCPEESVTRAQMAVFLLRAKHGVAYLPPAPGGSTGFGDVPPDHWAAAFIKQLVAEGITVGCGSGNYCPDAPVTRAQMAVFLVRTFNLP
jgi:hypothetical protein